MELKNHSLTTPQAMKHNLHCFLIISSILLGCDNGKKNSSGAKPSLLEDAQTYFEPLDLTNVPDKNDPKVVLGKEIFFDKRFSKDYSTSCNSCHDMAKFGVDNLAASHGTDGALTGRNSPTVLNVSGHIAQFWDGRAKTLRDQIRMPMLALGEMSMPDEAAILERLNDGDKYKIMFAGLYADGITLENMSDAVASFIESFTFPSKFDKFLNGEEELNDAALRGLSQFIDKGCVDCHAGQLFGGEEFEKFGIYYDYWRFTSSDHLDSGVYKLTKDPDDLFVFKVPSLRNSRVTYPYFHDGSVNDLNQAIIIMGKTQLDVEISKSEAADIAEFLNTLTTEFPDQDIVASSK